MGICLSMDQRGPGMEGKWFQVPGSVGGGPILEKTQAEA